MRALIIAALLLFSSSAFSSGYTWRIDYWGAAHTSYTSIASACSVLLASRNSAEANSDYYTHVDAIPGNAQYVGHVTMTCRSNWYRPDGTIRQSNYSIGNISRNNGSCDEGVEYDPVLGNCAVPEMSVCEAKTGTSSPFNITGTAPDAFVVAVSGSFLSTEQTACFSGCTAQTFDASCRNNSDGTYRCKGTADFTGAECTATPADPQAVADETVTADPLPAPITEVFELPCNYTTNADGTKTCQSEKTVSTEGQVCGQFNGETICETKQPTENGIKIFTGIEEETNADGSTTTTKTDVATKTSCVGMTCKVTTTTSITKTNADGTGTITASTTTCEGAGCTGNSSAGGDSGGECITNCGEGEGLGFAGPDLQDAPSFGDSMTAFIEGIQDARLLQTVNSLDFPSGGSCNIPTVSTTLGTLDFNIICQLAPSVLTPLETIFLIFWGFIAIRILLSA